MSLSIPNWLMENPGALLAPPAATRLQELPFDQLTWKNFERLCFRLASSESEIEHCQLYGNQGDAQDGIDIFGRKSGSNKYTVYQCKRVKDFGPQKIKDAVSAFISGEWLTRTEKFILCTQESLQNKKRTDEVETQAALLAESDVVLTVWDAPKLNSLMKEHPDLVDDFFGRAWVSCFCGSEAASSLEHSVSQDRRLAFQEWVRKSNESYSVPGLGIEMSIADSWIEIRTMDDSKDRRQSAKSFEKELENYNEWFRLTDSTTSLDKFSAHELPNFSNRCVVIGGPGSGKSTLCKRIAYDAAQNGAIVALVRLKRLQQQMTQGVTFETAILNEATTGFDLSQGEREWVGRNIEVLIADGLDECDPQRQDVSNELRKWLEGHTNTRVLVTTRPVGHHPSLLSGFDSFELLPLDELAIQTHSLALFQKAMDSEEHPATRWSEFINEVTSDKLSGKSMASRNPLLLGFLVRLSIDGIEIGKNRVALYDQIFQLMSKTTSSNQPGRPNISPEYANLSIDLAAFLMITQPMIRLDELVAAASKRNESNHDPSEFRAALTFWENSRAIERISAGHLNAIVFVHPALGEFAAARYIRTLDTLEFQKWFAASRRKPNWRQSILLACQIDDNRLISQLIEHDDADDPCSIEAVIAAEALAESTDHSTAAIECVTEALAARLTSSNPLICLEAAQALFQIVDHIQGEAFFVNEELLNHEYEWTRLGALALTVNSSHFDDHVGLFERWLQEFKYSSGISFGKWTRNHDQVMPKQAGELQHQAIEVGVPRLLKHRNRDEIEDYFRNGRDWGSNVSGIMFSTITDSLGKGGFKELAQELHQRVWKTPFDPSLFENTNSDPALIEAITLAARFVSHVAEYLAKRTNDVPAYLVDVLEATFTFWTEKGTWCRDHEVPTKGYSCPECNVCLPCPRESLLRLLFNTKLISSSELLPYLDDQQNDVTKVAKELFLNDATRNPALVGEVLDQILTDGVSISFLNELSELSSDTLSQNKCHFEKFLISENGSFRLAAINNLGSAWMPRKDAIVWARKFLDADTPTEKVSATKILRLLENS